MVALQVATLEAELLELFAPSVLPASNAFALHTENTRLLRMDAIHRANNLAQMSTSLADFGDSPKRRWLPTELTAHARRLARTYEELGVEHPGHAAVPCAELLTEIVTRLTFLFGQTRGIAIKVRADMVLLPPDVRRSLILISSELVINALKYGYPGQTGGMIAVDLAGTPNMVELVVEDDGVGLAETYRAGAGGGLLEKLVQVLGARIDRATRDAGHGFRVSMILPRTSDRPPVG